MNTVKNELPAHIITFIANTTLAVNKKGQQNTFRKTLIRLLQGEYVSRLDKEYNKGENAIHSIVSTIKRRGLPVFSRRIKGMECKEYFIPKWFLDNSQTPEGFKYELSQQSMIELVRKVESEIDTYTRVRDVLISKGIDVNSL